MASPQSWRNLLSQWMSACLAGVITGASLQLEQLTEALTYKDRSTSMEGCQKTLSPKSLFAVLVHFLLVRRASRSRVWWCPWYPASHSPVGAAPTSTSTAPAWDLWLTWDWNPNLLLLLQHRHPRRLSSGPQTVPGETVAGRKGADKHTTPSQDCDPTSQTESQTSGSNWTATLSRASGRAAALPAWPEHQLLPLPGLSGIPSIPRGDCY